MFVGADALFEGGGHFGVGVVAELGERTCTTTDAEIVAASFIVVSATEVVGGKVANLDCIALDELVLDARVVGLKNFGNGLGGEAEFLGDGIDKR